MLEVHKKNRRIAKPLALGQIEIDESWSIRLPKDDAYLAGCAADLADYFTVSMNMKIGIDQAATHHVITYEIDPALKKDGAYRIDVAQGCVRLIGKDARAAAQAGYLLEELMNLEEAPYLSIGVTDRAPIFRCRMVHSGYGEDMYPDGHLNAIAHSGINAILLYVAGINRTDLHELDFNDLITRAAKYGIDVYAYSHMESRLHPDDEGAEAFYDQLYGELFRQCPGIKGVILVGESTEFPSKDPRTSGMSWLKNKGPDGKPLIKKPNPGWFPCCDYPQWLNLVKDTIRKVKPDADVVFWTYNWIKSAEKEGLALLKEFPTDISINTRFDKEQDGERMGVPVSAADYTISFPNEGRRFTAEAEVVAARGMPLYSITNAGGLTWDLGVVPYLPAPYLWVKRFEAMRRCHKEYGLCGSMDSHHYGFYPSIISEIANEYLTAENPDGDQIIEKRIIRDWGKENKEKVERAFRELSDALYNHITSNTEQYGPLRIGPAYPLVLFDDENVKLWSYPGARHHGNMICNPHYKAALSYGNPAQCKQFDGEIRVYGSCAERAIDAARTLMTIADTLPENKREDAKRIAGVGEFMGRTFLTVYHLKRWYKEKVAISEGVGDRKAHLEELKRIGLLEIENVRKTIPLVEFDSRLGYEPSMDYVADVAHLEWKLELMNRILSEEIPRLEQEL